MISLVVLLILYLCDFNRNTCLLATIQAFMYMHSIGNSIFSFQTLYDTMLTSMYLINYGHSTCL